MEALIVVLAVAVGALIGLVVSDMAVRTRLKGELDTARAELQKACVEIAQAHNGMAQKVMDLGDKVQAHELKLTGSQTLTPPFGGPRRT